MRGPAEGDMLPFRQTVKRIKLFTRGRKVKKCSRDPSSQGARLGRIGKQATYPVREEVSACVLPRKITVRKIKIL